MWLTTSSILSLFFRFFFFVLLPLFFHGLVQAIYMQVCYCNLVYQGEHILNLKLGVLVFFLTGKAFEAAISAACLFAIPIPPFFFRFFSLFLFSSAFVKGNNFFFFSLFLAIGSLPRLRHNRPNYEPSTSRT